MLVDQQLEALKSDCFFSPITEIAFSLFLIYPSATPRNHLSRSDHGEAPRHKSPRPTAEVFSLRIEASLTLYTEYAALLVLLPPDASFTFNHSRILPRDKKCFYLPLLLLRSSASVFSLPASSFLYLSALINSA